MINNTDSKHLAKVKDQMKVMGNPTIKAVCIDTDFDVWCALEGSHRLQACFDLGLKPIIDEVEYNDAIFIGDQGDEYKICDMVDKIRKNEGTELELKFN